jgi:type IV pilus assembly protein PilC
VFFVSMVRAGEAAGMLDSILDQVAAYLEKVASIQRKIKAAVTYPIAVSIIAAAITVFLMVKVVPVFRGHLRIPRRPTAPDDPDHRQPSAVSSRTAFLWGLAGAIGMIFLVWQAGKTKRGRQLIDMTKLKMPIFGPLFLKVAVARFTRTLGTLIRSGVNILNALDITAKTANNVIIEAAVSRPAPASNRANPSPSPCAKA